MSKDLREQFDSYFDGAPLPDNLAEDAKKYVKNHTRRRTVAMRTVCAAACALFVCVLVGAVYLSGSMFPASQNPESPSAAENKTYTMSSLTASYADPYSLANTSPSFAILENLAYADNCSVNGVTLYTDEEGTPYLVRAEISALFELTRYDATLYIETAGFVCDDLKDYISGELTRYGSLRYCTTLERDNGEYCYDVYATDGGVKYYFTLTSSDSKGYMKLLELLQRNG